MTGRHTTGVVLSGLFAILAQHNPSDGTTNVAPSPRMPEGRARQSMLDRVFEPLDPYGADLSRIVPQVQPVSENGTMSRYENKTKPTSVVVAEFIAHIEHPVRRADAEILDETFRRVTRQEPVMWGPTIVGYGQYHYEYDSGHRGDAFAAGFSPRKASLSLYGQTMQPEAPELLEKLGKHRLGASCLYINKLADVDLDVLEELIRTGYRYVTQELDQPRT